MSVNKVILIGRLGNDPELRDAASSKVASFSVATSERWKNEQGVQERTEWHRIVVWGRQAETCAKFLSKGREVYIEGRIQSRQYDDKEGVTRYLTEIVASTVTFLGGGNQGNNSGGSSSGGAGGQAADFNDGDIPF